MDAHEALVEKVAEAVDAELGRTEMVLTDPITLRRLMAARISRHALSVVAEALREPTPAMIDEGEKSHVLISYGMAHDCVVAALSVSPLYPKKGGGNG